MKFERVMDLLVEAGKAAAEAHDGEMPDGEPGPVVCVGWHVEFDFRHPNGHECSLELHAMPLEDLPRVIPGPGPVI